MSKFKHTCVHDKSKNPSSKPSHSTKYNKKKGRRSFFHTLNYVHEHLRKKRKKKKIEDIVTQITSCFYGIYGKNITLIDAFEVRAMNDKPE